MVTAVRRGALAATACWALEQEALLTPKPGLVDRRGPGAHEDMDLRLVLASAAAIEPWLARAEGLAGLPLAVCGLRAERAMLAATGGVNTHRGAIFSLGLLISAAARSGSIEPVVVAEHAAALACSLPQAAGSRNGAAARRRYRVGGAPAQAQAGFPAVIGHALPTLDRRRDAGEDVARLDALLAIMRVLDDTCLLHRGGTRGLARVREGAADVLAAGGCGTPAGAELLGRLDRRMRRHRLSPGGSGDLLAATLFLDAIRES